MTAPPDADKLLGVYLNDHLMGATAGTELARRLAKAEQSWSGGGELALVADEIAADRATLREIMAKLDVPAQFYRSWLGWAGEKAGRLKTNRRLFTRSPLSRVLELELLRLGIEGKGAGWRTLLQVAETEPRLSADQLERLIERAQSQIDTVEELRIRAAREVFTR
jgi:hypothetical protein